MSKNGLTVEDFLDHFRLCTGWECKPGTPIVRDLTEFADKRLGSTRDIEELHVIFCMSKNINPYPERPDWGARAASEED